MVSIKKRILSLVNLLHSIKEAKLVWQLKNQNRQDRLKHAQTLAENDLAAELKKRSVQLAHDISVIKTRHATELAMCKTKYKQDVEDYHHYLNSLDRLKVSILNRYPQLPEAVAFTIHHHAKHLLHNMWEAQDYKNKVLHEQQLIQFMTTIHEDAHHFSENDPPLNLPEKTLRLIEKQ